MTYKCKKCGQPVLEVAIECPNCYEKDPTGRMEQDANRMKERLEKDADKFKKKMSGELPLDA